MTPEMYAKELDAEIRMLYENYDHDFKMVQGTLDSDSFLLSMMEDGNQEGIITKMIRTMKEFIEKITNQIKKILFGAKVVPGQENAQIKLDKDPNILTKFLNGDIKDSKDYLRRARNGEISVEEAKAFVQKKDGQFANIKGAVVPAAGTLAFCLAKQKFFDNWKNEAMDMYKTSAADGTNKFADKVSNLASSENKSKQATEGAEMILLNHTQQTTKRLSDMIIGPIKTMYQKGVIKNTIMDEAEKRNTKSGRRELTKQKKQEIKAYDKASKSEWKQKQGRDAYRGTEKSLGKERRGAIAGLNDTLNKSYLDMNQPVDKKALRDRK